MKGFNYQKERKKIDKIKVGTQHRVYRDKWLRRKNVFDVIFKNIELKQFDNKTLKIHVDEFIGHHLNNANEAKAYIKIVLEQLEQQKIISIPQNPLLFLEETDILTRPNRYIFNNYVIFSSENDEELEDKYNNISEFCQINENDGRSRFSQCYGISFQDIKNEQDSLMNNQQKKDKELKKIKNIIAVEENQSKPGLLVINKEYGNPIEIREKSSAYIKSLYEAIVNKTDLKIGRDQEKKCIDALNFTRNCQIYTQKGKQNYELTEIVVYKDVNSYRGIEINSRKITTDVISRTRFNTLKIRQKNNRKREDRT
ncbi:MAG: hypothetical protein GF335_04865 [Candidatus Moranbacteria bacterium]|nr:hypothetical protein [Candidatus Moranbacteria bacterium]